MSDNRKDEEPRSNEDPRSDVSEHRGGDEYKVGRNRPPLHSRFKKGTSGNPRGRPRRAPLDVTRQIQKLFLDDIRVQEGNKKKRISRINALVQKTLTQALMGDHKATVISLGLAREFGVFHIKEELEADFSDLTPEENELVWKGIQILLKHKKL